MRLFSRRRRTPDAAQVERRSETLQHFRRFVASREGVEGYLEPPTPHDPHTLVLVARTGEWTRRRVPSPKAARALGKQLDIPVHDVNFTGYPPRMRAWTSAQRRKR